MPCFLGVDSSLTGTGLARIYIPPDLPKGAEIASRTRYESSVIQLATIKTPKKAGKLLDTSYRISYAIDRIEAAMIDGPPLDAVGLEEIPYGAKGSARTSLTWLWGRVIDLCVRHSLPLYLVNVSAVKKFGTGNGNAGKDEVMLSMAERFPEAHISDNNQSDALAVGMLVARLELYPVDTMPMKHLDLKKIERQ